MPLEAGCPLNYQVIKKKEKKKEEEKKKKGEEKQKRGWEKRSHGLQLYNTPMCFKTSLNSPMYHFCPFYQNTLAPLLLIVAANE